MRKSLWTITLLVLAVAATAYALVPIILLVAASVEPQPDKIFSYWDPLSIHAFIPPGISLGSYTGTLNGTFGIAMLNSIIVASVTVVIGVTMCVLAAFALAVFRFRSRELLFGLLVVSFLIPFDAVSIPLSGTFRSWGLGDSLTGLILPGLASGVAVFLLRQFFLGIPRDLVDASRVDGMSSQQILRFVFIPLSKAPIIGAGLLLFLAQWQEYLWPVLTITDTSHEVAPVALGEFVTQFSTDFRGMFAAAVLTTALPVALVLLLQRFFAQTVIGTEGK
jgi:putative chitobiose transport system permease protein